METNHGPDDDLTNDSQVVGRVDVQAGAQEPLAGTSPLARIALFIGLALIMVAAILLIFHHVFTT